MLLFILLCCFSCIALTFRPSYLSLFHKAIKKSNRYFDFRSSSIKNDDVIHEFPDEGTSSSLFVSDVSQFGINTALAEEHLELGNLEEAAQLAKKAIEIAKKTGEPDNVYAAYAESILGDSLYAMGSFELAAQHYKTALKAHQRHSHSSIGPEAVELTGSYLGIFLFEI